jgi:hypothetical protein
MIELNALDILKKRKVDITPVHFTRTRISERDLYTENLETWIQSKLKGRYYIKKYPNIGNDGKLKTNTYVGFEIPAELTHFLLACPHLRRTL